MSVRFDDGGDHLLRTSGIVDYNSAYTVMFWMRESAFASPGWAWGALGSSTDFNGAAATSDRIGFWGARLNIGANNIEFGDFASELNELDTWRHVCIVRSSTTDLKAYLDGAHVITLTTDVSSRSAVAAEVLGRVNGSGNALNGAIAAFKSWGAALSSGEIIAEMSVGPPVRTSDLVTYTPFTATTEPEIFQSVTGTNWSEEGAVTSEGNPPIDWGGGGGGNALLLQLMQHGQFNGGLL